MLRWFRYGAAQHELLSPPPPPSYSLQRMRSDVLEWRQRATAAAAAAAAAERRCADAANDAADRVKSARERAELAEAIAETMGMQV